MKSRMRWAGHVARMGRGEVLQGFGCEARIWESTGKHEFVCLIGEVKVKLSLCLTKDYAMKTYVGVEV
jgi:hypothetical protein